MKRFYQKLELKNRDIVMVPAEVWAKLEPIYWDIKNKKLASHTIQVDRTTFDLANIVYSKQVSEEQYSVSDEPRNVLPDDKRLENIQRLQAYNAACYGAPRGQVLAFNPKQQAWYDEMKLFRKEGIYPKSDWRHEAGISGKDWSKARMAFFDVLWDSQDHERVTLLAYYSKFVKGNEDPRNFDRDQMIKEGRDSLLEGSITSYNVARKVFNV